VQLDLIPDAWTQYCLEQDLRRWEREKRPPFPHLLKQRIVLDYAASCGAQVFIETGTYYGNMLEACFDHFDQLVSCEIEKHFYRRAQRRFRHKSKVKVLHGDSGKLLPDLLRPIKCSCLFWLDAHYSCGLTGTAEMETPIACELEAILRHPYGHTILIDDASSFAGTNDYPTIAWVEQAARRAGYSFAVSDNIIRLAAPRHSTPPDLANTQEQLVESPKQTSSTCD
jgi:hypothetical protein